MTQPEQTAGPAPLAPHAGGRDRPLRIFFDCDDTLLTWDWRLRPHTREVLDTLAEWGCEAYLWSGLGARWDVVEHFELGELLHGCFAKPLYRHRERLTELGVPFAPDYAVDDYAEIVAVFGGWQVPVPLQPLADDHHLLLVLHDIARCFGFPTAGLPEPR